jgi:hypothetical protein
LGLLSQSQLAACSLARLDNPKSFGMMFDASLSNKKKEEKKNYFYNFG